MIQNLKFGNKIVLEIDGGVSCTVMSIFNSIELYSLKWLNGIFCYVYFTKTYCLPDTKKSVRSVSVRSEIG